MREKRKRRITHYAIKHRRALALVMTLALLLSAMSASAFTLSADTDEGLYSDVGTESRSQSGDAAICICSHDTGEDGTHANPDCPLYVRPISELGYIGADDTPLYEEASAGSRILAPLAKNTEVTILSRTEQWLNIACGINGGTLNGFVVAAQVLEAQIDLTLELLPNHTLAPVTAEDGSVISVSGLLPENACLTVTPVGTTDAVALIGTRSEADILFAYDIKIMLPAQQAGGTATEYQPTVPVTVSITPPEDKPIEVPVEVTHISEDARTGETTPRSVANVVATVNGGVEFSAEGFSVYVITLRNTHTVTINVDADMR